MMLRALLVAALSLASAASEQAALAQSEAACSADSDTCIDEDHLSLLQTALYIAEERKTTPSDKEQPLPAPPSFTLSLDDAPEQRWVGVATFYKEELVALAKHLNGTLHKDLGDALPSWLEVAGVEPEYEAELQGIVDTVNHPAFTLDFLKLMQLIYEMGAPVACSGVLWALENGTVMHGRNMDYGIALPMPDGRVLNWPDLTSEVTVTRGGKHLYKMVHWPGFIGLHTAMRYNGWAFQQNTRKGSVSTPNSDSLFDEKFGRENLQAAQKGGLQHSLAVRRIMETTPDFHDAVKKVYAIKLMAPQYFIMSGAGPNEGAVLTMDRLGQHLPDTPPIQSLGNASGGPWHLVQTNDDLLHPSLDPRRPLANMLLDGVQEDEVEEFVSVDNLMQFLRRPMNLFDPLTVFSTVMVPATGYFKTVLSKSAGMPEAPDKDSVPSRQKGPKAKLHRQALLSAPAQRSGMH